jgi:hypothetical protein
MIENYEAELAKDPDNLKVRTALESLRNRVTGNKYRGRSKKHLIDKTPSSQYSADKKSLYKVIYGKYAPFYIGHYDKGKYKEQMNRYRQGIIKSRSNGRRWCRLPTYFYKYGQS